MLFGKECHQVRTRDEKALALVEDTQTSFDLEITNKLFSAEYNVL